MDRTEDGLECVGEDRGTLRAAALQFALAEPEELAQRQVARDADQRLLPHQARAQPGKFAFPEFAKVLVKRAGDDTIQYRVAEELEPLVVGETETTMGERLAQQLGSAEVMAERRLQPLRVH
jgi:hypothetical protein